jgi:hypothetical protein
MKTLRDRSPCNRGLLAIAVMAVAMFIALAAGGRAAAQAVGPQAPCSPQSPSMAASFMATPVEPWIFSLPDM